MSLLQVENLSVNISVPSGILHAVRDVSLSIARGETLCLVGESGCGKSLTSLAIMGLLPSTAERTASRLSFDGKDIGAAPPSMLRDMRGRDLSMIFQEPMTCLNACLTVGEQLMEVFRRHRGRHGSRAEARERALFLLEKVGISNPVERLSQYPHEFSGGMRQRVMIAMALMCNPRLIIADEPTTALDVTIQAQILALLKNLQEEFGLALLLITHDLGVVSCIGHRVSVMYAGQVVETGTTEEIFNQPSHPYTRGLLACMPGVSSKERGTKLGSIPGQVPNLIGDLRGCSFRNRCSLAVPDCAGAIPFNASGVSSHRYRCILPPFAPQVAVIDASQAATTVDRVSPVRQSDIVLEAKSVSQTYRTSSSFFGASRSVPAVNDVSLAVHAGEIVAIVGESGCGKSTLAMMMLGLLPPTSGEVHVAGQPLSALKRHELPRRMQPVFQDPYASLNPRRSIEAIVAEPLHVQRIGVSVDRERRMLEVLDAVGLPRRLRRAYPAQLSGGQRQRVAIARALVMKPQVLICDEPTSALDVSVQAQVLNLLMDLHAEFNLTYVVISHNLAVVEHIASRVCVMQRGRIVEEGETESIFRAPKHPYTQTLLKSILAPRPRDAGDYAFAPQDAPYPMGSTSRYS